MIGTYSMSTETQAIADTIEKVIEDTKESMKPKLKKFSDEIFDALVNNYDCFFSMNNKDNYLLSISHEVRKIMTNLLAGDIDQIKQLNIIDEYTFDRLHEIRLKIWETCSKEIENSIIHEQKKQIESLRQEVKYARNY